MVFIVEPVFWIAFGIPLAAGVRRKPLRWSLFALMAAVPLGVTLAGFLQWGSLPGLLVLGVLLALAQRHARRRPRGARSRAALAAGLALSLAFVGVQAVALGQARALVASSIARLDPGERLLDTALSAFPANPLCWSFVTVARAGDGAAAGAGASVHLRRGLLSIAPGITRAASCPAAIGGAANAADAVAAADTKTGPDVAWQFEQREPLADLRRLRADNCHVDAWLRFARAPALAPAQGIATDARWGPPGSLNFSSLWYADLASRPCPHPVPGWGYPRADLLGLR